MNISQLNGSYLGSSGADGVGSSIGGGTSSTMFPSFSNTNAAYGGDGFESQYPSYANGSSQNTSQNGIMSAIMSMMSGIMGMLQSLAQSLGGGSSQSATGAAQADPETAFAKATVSSTGDPHLAMSGTESNGATTSNKFDSMVSHQDLIDSNSIPGGFRVSTNVTSPINSNGVTLNQSATIHSNFGQNSVSMDNTGNVTVTKEGQPVTLTVGQATKLGDGETVTKNSDGSVTVVNSNHNGGSVTTTLSLNGGAGGTRGVDVTTTANNVDLGGDIVNGNATPQTASSNAQPTSSGFGSGLGSQFPFALNASSLAPTAASLYDNIFDTI